MLGQHLIVIAGFIVAVANIDAFCFHNIAGFGIGKLEITGVLHSGGRKRVGCPCIYQATGRSSLAGQHLGNTREALQTWRADPQRRIHAVLLIIDPIHFHRIGAVDEDDRLAEFSAVCDQLEHFLFGFMQGKMGNAVTVRHGQILALAAIAAEQHDGRVVIVIFPGSLEISGIEGGTFLSDEPVGLSLPSAQFAAFIGFEQLVIDNQALALQPGAEGHEAALIDSRTT